MKSLALLFPLLFTSSVLAHGFVDILTIGSQAYQGQEPSEDGQPNSASVIRRISTIDPVKGATNPDVNCGYSAEAASLNANASPGDRVLVKWVGGGGQNVSWSPFSRKNSQYRHIDLIVAPRHRLDVDLYGFLRQHHLRQVWLNNCEVVQDPGSWVGQFNRVGMGFSRSHEWNASQYHTPLQPRTRQLPASTWDHRSPSWERNGWSRVLSLM